MVRSNEPPGPLGPQIGIESVSNVLPFGSRLFGVGADHGQPVFLELPTDGHPLKRIFEGPAMPSFAVDGGGVYWTEPGTPGKSDGKVWRRPRDGETRTVLAGQLRFPSEIASDGQMLYFVAEGEGGKHAVIALPNGGGAWKWLAWTQLLVGALDTDETGAYFANGELQPSGAIFKSERGGPPRPLVSNLCQPHTLFVDPSGVYFTDCWGNISRIPRTGGTPTAIHKAASDVGSIWHDGDYLYFTEGPTFDSAASAFRSDGAVKRISLGGGGGAVIAERLPFVGPLRVAGGKLYISGKNGVEVVDLARLPR
jgi:hypothetical protein